MNDNLPDNAPAALRSLEVQHLTGDTGKLLELYQDYEVETQADYLAGANDLKAIKAMQKKIEEERKAITGPMDASKKAVMDFFRPFTAKLGSAEVVIKSRLLAWKEIEDRKVREAQRLENERAEKAAAKLRKEAEVAEAKGKTARSEILEERAEVVQAAPLAPAAPKVEGISTRTVWRFEVTHPNMVPDKYLLIDEKKIGGVVRALKGDTDIPGVRVYSEQVMAAGRS